MKADSLEDEFQSGRLAAIELVEHAKRMMAAEVELPVVDETGEWLVTVKRVSPSLCTMIH